MRTNIMIDDALMREAQTLSGIKTKRNVIQKALEEYVRSLKKRDLREIRGKVRFAEGYDYKKARAR
jgi:Arc/MetJ family transcription regulator